MPAPQSIDDSPVISAQAQHIGAGESRKTQEDTCEAVVIRLADGTLLYAGMVADGMGGIEGGEIASRTAVRAALNALERGRQADLPTLLRAALEMAHARVQAIQQELGLGPMGTTATLAAITPDSRLYLAHAGDSRAYLVRGGLAVRLTHDHTWGEQQVRSGAMTLEEVRLHERRDALVRYIGQPRPLEIDLRLRLRPGESDAQAQANQGLPLQPGDVVVLCSDGLIKPRPRGGGHFVEAEEIAAIAGQAPPQQAVKRLIDLALERGADDNIAVVVLAIGGEAVGDETRPSALDAAPLPEAEDLEEALAAAPTPEAAPAPQRRSPLPLLIGGALAVAAAVAIALLALDVVGGGQSPPSAPTPFAGPSSIAVRQVEGTVTRLVGDTGLEPLRAGSALPAGERVVLQTQAGSRAAIELLDQGVTLYVGPISEVWLEPAGDGSGTRLTLNEGRVLVASQGGQPFAVSAPDDKPRAILEGAAMGVERVRRNFDTGQPQRFVVDCLDGPCVFHGESGPAPLGLEVCVSSALQPDGLPGEPEALRANRWQDVTTDPALVVLCAGPPS